MQSEACEARPSLPNINITLFAVKEFLMSLKAVDENTKTYTKALKNNMNGVCVDDSNPSFMWYTFGVDISYLIAKFCCPVSPFGVCWTHWFVSSDKSLLHYDSQHCQSVIKIAQNCYFMIKEVFIAQNPFKIWIFWRVQCKRFYCTKPFKKLKFWSVQ